MSTLLVLFLAALAYGLIVVILVSTVVSGAQAERLADRLLGPGSSADLELGLMVALDESQSPPAERRR
jgi:hypothetical protein